VFSGVMVFALNRRVMKAYLLKESLAELSSVQAFNLLIP
jgi:hypothetical protein